ncbi:hypothetical protein LP420_18335 [Massilia sp. B-10]|nr:hypothetical protein LP420_18335 [Massilia sp. B-10]
MVTKRSSTWKRVELDTGTQTPSLIHNNDGLYLLKGMQSLPASIRTGLA